MGSRYVYKLFRKIKIVKYCKRWPNHISNRTSGVSTLQACKVDTPEVIWPSFTVFYYFDFTKYFVNIMGFH